MTETMDAADDEVYVRLTGDERRIVVNALEAWVGRLDLIAKNVFWPERRANAKVNLANARRVLAKVSE